MHISYYNTHTHTQIRSYMYMGNVYTEKCLGGLNKEDKKAHRQRHKSKLYSGACGCMYCHA